MEKIRDVCKVLIKSLIVLFDAAAKSVNCSLLKNLKNIFAI